MVARLAVLVPAVAVGGQAMVEQWLWIRVGAVLILWILGITACGSDRDGGQRR